MRAVFIKKILLIQKILEFINIPNLKKLNIGRNNNKIQKKNYLDEKHTNLSFQAEDRKFLKCDSD